MNVRMLIAPVIGSILISAAAQRPARHWAGTAIVINNGNDTKVEVPVELDLGAPQKNGAVSGAFLNGDLRSPSSSGTLTGGHLKLQFHSFARTLEGDFKGDTFTGTFGGARIKKPYTLTLHRDRDGKPSTVFAAASKAVSKKGSAINGTWEIALPEKSEKGEDAWTMTVAPFRGDGEVRVVIQRIDGDTGALFGRYDEAAGEYRVSRFGDFGASIYSIKLQSDGTLRVTDLRNPKESNIARRPEEARKAKLAPPTATTEQTTVVNPSEPLRFQGQNLTGQTITSTDADFKGKVVIVAIGGSWCPNCHDEAPLLVELYNKYHRRGLEVVDLSFEEEDQLKNPERLRAFVSRYNIPYTVLLMGTPDQLNEKLPQGKNLNSWPTSFFVGRDGLVKETHAGFSGPATGEAYTHLRAETIALVEKLLAQPAK